MKRKPTVSIAIPAFNAARTLGTTIESVLCQSYEDFELVVCNDASTDQTASVVRSFADQRVRLVDHSANGGEGFARDAAITAATGTWIAFLDADDAWAPNRLETLLAAAKGESDVMVFDDLMSCHDTPNGMLPWRRLRGNSAFGTRGKMARDVSIESFIQSDRLLIKPIVRSEVITRFGVKHSRRRFGADSEYFLKLMSLGTRLRYVPEPMYLYRITPGSATALAKAPHLMRECIEEALNFGGFSDSARVALSNKISALRLNEKLYALADHFQHRRFGDLANLLYQDPQLFRLIPRRLARVIMYHCHRIASSGNSRRSGY